MSFINRNNLEIFFAKSFIELILENLVPRKFLAIRYYKAFKSSYENLVKALPIELLIPALYSKNIISSGLKAEIDSIVTSSKKVEHLLTKIENGLKVEVTEQFEGLLQVMEEYSQKEESAVVKKLAEEIRSSISSAQSPGT